MPPLPLSPPVISTNENFTLFNCNLQANKLRVGQFFKVAVINLVHDPLQCFEKQKDLSFINGITQSMETATG